MLLQILNIRNDIGFNQLRIPRNMKFLALWDDALLYAYDQQIILRNLVTRKVRYATSDHCLLPNLFVLGSII